MIFMPLKNFRPNSWDKIYKVTLPTWNYLWQRTSNKSGAWIEYYSQLEIESYGVNVAINEWLTNNCIDLWAIYLDTKDKNHIKLYVAFKNKNDALLFKLSESGICINTEE